MVTADFFNVHVDDLAALEVLVEEGDRDVLGLSDDGQELLLVDLGVGTVTLDFIQLLLLVFGLDGIHTRFLVASH